MTGLRFGSGFAGAVAIAAVVLAASLWTWGVPLTNDGPAHVLGAWVHLHPERYAGIWEPNAPITAHGFLETQQVLVPLLGWRDAWRIHVVLMTEAWAFGYLAFVMAVAPQRRWLGLLGFPLALHPNVYMGFFAFTGASACAWFTLAYWLRTAQERSRAVEHTILAALLLLTALLHVVPAALCGLILAVVTLARAQARPRTARLLRLVIAGVPAGIIALLASGTDGGAQVEPAEGNLAERLWNVGASFPGGPPWRIALAFALATLGLIGVIRRARAPLSAPAAAPPSVPSGQVEQALALCAIVLLCASWAAPRDFAGWQYAGGRFAPLGIGVLLALAPLVSLSAQAHGRSERLVLRVDRALAICTALLAGVFVLASLAWSFALHAALRVHNAPALAALDAVASSPSIPAADVSSWAMIALDPREGAEPLLGHQPLFHLHHLFALERGGFATDAQDRAPTIHPLRVVRPVGAEPLAMVRDDVDAELQALVLRRQLSYAAAHGAVVIAGTEADHDTALAAGFAPIARARAPDPEDTNGVLVARFEGCGGRVRIEGIAEPVALQVGWWPRRSPVVTVQVPAPRAEGEPATSVDVPLPPLACGDVWISPVAPPGARCNGVEGPVRATFSRASDNVIVCALAPP